MNNNALMATETNGMSNNIIFANVKNRIPTPTYLPCSNNNLLLPTIKRMATPTHKELVITRSNITS